MESLLQVLESGGPIGRLDVYAAYEMPISSKALANFFSGIFSGPQDPSLKILSIDTFQFICDQDWHFEALCSTFPVARTPIGNLELCRSGPMWYQEKPCCDQMRLLAETLLFPRTASCTSHPSIHGLDLYCSVLKTADLEEIATAVSEKTRWCGSDKTSPVG